MTFQRAPCWVSPAKSKVTPPADGDPPLKARNTDNLTVAPVSVATCVQVKPLPVTVGVGGKSVPIAQITANITTLEAGVYDPVTNDVPSTSEPLLTRVVKPIAIMNFLGC